MADGLKVTLGPGGKSISLGQKDDSRYQHIAQQLIPFTSPDRDQDGNTMYLIERLHEVFEGLKINTAEIPIMIEKGFLEINDKHPESFYVHLKGKPAEELPAIKTKTLQRLAKRLYKRALKEENSELHYLSRYLIEIYLSKWLRDADVVIPQLKGKGYLREKKNGTPNPDSQHKFFYIFSTQKQSRTFMDKKTV